MSTIEYEVAAAPTCIDGAIPALSTCRAQVLVVEDHHDMNRLLATKIGAYGHEVISAYDGLAGWKAATENRPSAIVLDLGLPKLNGTDLLMRLRRDPRTNGLPIVIITGSRDVALFDVIDGWNAIRRLFFKPTLSAQIAAAVHSVLTE